MRQFLRRLSAAAALGFGGVVLVSGAGWAQDFIPQRGGVADSVTRTAPLSMQSQLGAIPLVSPRMGSRASLVRRVLVAQVVDGVQLGTAQEIICPETGCQQGVALRVNQVPESFHLDVQFVMRGTYVALSSRSAAIASVVEHRQGRPGPVFMKATGTVTEGTLAFSMAPATSLRRLDVAQKGGQTLAQGNVYTRKREPDVVLRISIGAPEPAK